MSNIDSSIDQKKPNSKNCSLKFNSDSILTKLAVFFIISLFIGPGLSLSKFYLFHIGIIAVCIYLMFEARYSSEKRFWNDIKKTVRNKYLLVPLAFLIYPLIYAVFVGPKQSIIYSFSYNLLGLVAIIISTTFIRLYPKKTLFGLLVIFIIHLIISFLEIETSFRWPISKYSSMLDHFFKRTPSTTINMYHLQRPTSFFWNPNNAILVLVLGLPFLLLGELKNVFKFFSLTLTSIVVLLGASRLMIILLAMFYLSFFLIEILRRNKINVYLLSLSLVVSIGYFSWSKTPYQSRRIHSTANLLKLDQLTSLLFSYNPNENLEAGWVPDNSVSNRFAMQGAALKRLKRNPLIGIGPGGLSEETYKNGTKELSLASIHNYWLEVATEYGIPFFILYIGWYSHILFKNIDSIKTNKDNDFRIAVIASLILFAPGVLVLSSAKYYLPKWLLIALAIGLLSNTNKEVAK